MFIFLPHILLFNYFFNTFVILSTQPLGNIPFHTLLLRYTMHFSPGIFILSLPPFLHSVLFVLLLFYFFLDLHAPSSKFTFLSSPWSHSLFLSKLSFSHPFPSNILPYVSPLSVFSLFIPSFHSLPLIQWISKFLSSSARNSIYPSVFPSLHSTIRLLVNFLASFPTLAHLHHPTQALHSSLPPLIIPPFLHSFPSNLPQHSSSSGWLRSGNEARLRIRTQPKHSPLKWFFIHPAFC